LSSGLNRLCPVLHPLHKRKRGTAEAAPRLRLIGSKPRTTPRGTAAGLDPAQVALRNRRGDEAEAITGETSFRLSCSSRSTLRPNFRPTSELSGEEPTSSEVCSEVLANLASESMRRRSSAVVVGDCVIHTLSTEMELSSPRRHRQSFRSFTSTTRSSSNRIPSHSESIGRKLRSGPSQ
jgi:hypothetical protein